MESRGQAHTVSGLLVVTLGYILMHELIQLCPASPLGGIY